MRRPLFLIGWVFLAGTAGAFCIPWSDLPIVFIVLGMSAVVSLIAGNQKVMGLIFATLALSGANVLLYQGTIVRPLWALEGQTLPIEGLVEEVEVRGYGTVYTLNAKVEGKRTKLSLYSYEEPVAEMGDFVVAQGEICVAEQKFEWGKRIFLHVLGSTPVEKKASKSFAGDLLHFRAALLSKTAELYTGPVRGLMQGMLFAYTQNIEPESRAFMNDSGLAHLLSVSGLHVSIVAAFFLQVILLLGMNRRWALWLTLPALLLYIALAGFTASVMRAGIQSIFTICAGLCGRKADRLTGLGFSVFCILVGNPYSVYHAGFLLSFAAVLGIILYAEEIESRILAFPQIGRWFPEKGGWGRKLIAGIATSLAVYVFLIPVLLWFFHGVPIYAALSAVLTLWAVGPVLFLGLLSVLLGFCGTSLLPLAKIVAMGASLLCKEILLVAKGVSALPFAVVYSREWNILAWSLCSVGIFLWISLGKEGRKKAEQHRLYDFALCFCVCVLCANLNWNRLSSRSLLQITASESALVLTKGGRGAVVGDICSEFEAEEIVDIFHSAGVERPELLLCSSRTLEESSGISSFLERMEVGTCIIPETGKYLDFIQAVRRENNYPLAPLRIEILDDVSIEVVERESQFDRQRLDLKIVAGEKVIYKTSQKYDIIGQYSGRCGLVFDGENQGICLEASPNMGLYQDSMGHPILKLRTDQGGKKEDEE